jgi:TonB-dependent SusC/RagA subfamily outer membrane receptor
LLLAVAAHAQQPPATAPLAPDSLVGASRERVVKIINPADSVTLTARAYNPAFTTLQPALSRVAGVQVTPYSGAPGAWSTVRIRGVSNVTGYSQPLYVVDGVPAYNTDVTPEKWDGISYFDRNGGNPNATRTPHTPTANPFLDIPVEDISSVEVVKGAAATARYGMQGTNGVIIVTTKRGADGRATPQPLRVRYAGWGGVQQVRQRYDLLNAYQYAGLMNEAAANYGRPAPYSPTDLASLTETDWQDRLFRVAGIQSHNLSVDGLTHRTRYYVAADYLRQTGVVAGSELSRYQLRANIDQQLTSKLSLGLRANANQTDQRYAGTEFDGGPLLQNALLGIPAVPARRVVGSRSILDPLNELNYYRSTPRTRRLLAQLSATYQFSPALSLTVRGSREQAEARELSYSPDNYPPAVPNVVETATATTSNRNWVADAVLRYQHTFADRHALTTTLTYLRQQYERTLEQKTQTQYSSSFFRFEEKLTHPIYSPSASFVYTYDGRYEVQGSLRAEMVFGSGNFADNYRLLPGGQVSWHANKEAFLAGATTLSDLTLWAGAGQTSTFFSPDRTTHHDAGLRLGLLDGHLTLEAAAYQRRTRHAQTELTTFVSMPGGIRFIKVSPDVKLLNQGLELTVGSTWRVGNISGVTQVAAATNRNEVEDTSLDFPINGLEKGTPVSRFFVYEQDGTYPVGSPDAGQTRFRDRNGDGQSGFGDGYYQSGGLPRYTLNLYQELRFSRFQLAAQFDGLFGYQLLNQTLRYLDEPSGYENNSVRALNYWTPSNQNTSVPRPGTNPSPYLSDQALASGNHVRLSQLTISYDVLPTGPRKISVWVGGQNLFVTGTYRGFDPNVSSGGAATLYAGQDASVYPVARMWQLGARAAF